MQTITSDYISPPQKRALKMPLERVSHFALFFFLVNCVYFISGSLICRVNESKADRDMICSFGINFKSCHLPETELVRARWIFRWWHET